MTHWLIMAFMVNAGTSPPTATATGGLIGAVVNYILQRKVTFRSNAAHGSILLRYLGVCTLIWFANLAFFLVFYRIALFSSVYAQGFTTFSVAIMSYFLYKRVVFHVRK